jgi:hypothetical protein
MSSIGLPIGNAALQSLVTSALHAGLKVHAAFSSAGQASASAASTPGQLAPGIGTCRAGLLPARVIVGTPVHVGKPMPSVGLTLGSKKVPDWTWSTSPPQPISSELQVATPVASMRQLPASAQSFTPSHRLTTLPVAPSSVHLTISWPAHAETAASSQSTASVSVGHASPTRAPHL